MPTGLTGAVSRTSGSPSSPCADRSPRPARANNEEPTPPSGTRGAGRALMEATRTAPHTTAPPPAPLPRGLTAAEVADRRARGLVNRAARSHRAEYWDILSRNLFTLFNAL